MLGPGLCADEKKSRGHNPYLFASARSAFGLGPGLRRASGRSRRFSSRATKRVEPNGRPVRSPAGSTTAPSGPLKAEMHMAVFSERQHPTRDCSAALARH